MFDGGSGDDAAMPVMIVIAIITAKKQYNIMASIIEKVVSFSHAVFDKEPGAQRLVARMLAEKVVLKMIQHVEAIQLQQQSLLATVAEVVDQSSGSCIHAKTLMGQTVQVDGIDANTTIEQVKEGIQHKEGIPAEMQQVLDAGKQLEHGRTCGDYNIQGGTELHMVPNLRGGTYDSISGRQGFKVVANKIVFDDGNEWKFDGSPESLQRYSDHEQKLVSFASKAEMLSYLESCRMEELLRRLELVQSRGREVAKEAALCLCLSRKASQNQKTEKVADEFPPEDPQLDDALLERMLRRQEELRFAPETLERMRACTASGGEWLDVVRDLQREVAIESGFRSAVGISTAARRMQTAHTVAPKLAKLSVYARANLAEDGFLKPGQPLPDVALVDLDGQSKRLKAHATDVWPIDGPQVLEPQSTMQRLQTALEFQRKCKLTWTMAVDGIEDAFLHSFAPWPFRFYVFRGDRLEFKSAPVDGTHSFDEVEEAIRKFEAELSG
ncbi:TU20 [Symbiodinium microadriaticum]|nr:TU20 [Symbiodinium microadriaticum]CAE7943550.1 TU20 [Symbiodinium sp. KB8]